MGRLANPKIFWTTSAITVRSQPMRVNMKPERPLAAARVTASPTLVSSSCNRDSIWKAMTVVRFSYRLTARFKASSSGCKVFCTSDAACATTS